MGIPGHLQIIRLLLRLLAVLQKHGLVVLNNTARASKTAYGGEGYTRMGSALQSNTVIDYTVVSADLVAPDVHRPPEHTVYDGERGDHAGVSDHLIQTLRIHVPCPGGVPNPQTSTREYHSWGTQALQAPHDWQPLIPAVEALVPRHQTAWDANCLAFYNETPPRPPVAADQDAACEARRVATLPYIQQAYDRIDTVLSEAMLRSVAPEGGIRTERLSTSRRHAPWWSDSLARGRQLVQQSERRLSDATKRASGTRPPLSPPARAELARRARQQAAAGISPAEWPAYGLGNDLVGLRVRVLRPPAAGAPAQQLRRFQEGTISMPPVQLRGRVAPTCVCRMLGSADAGTVDSDIILGIKRVGTAIRRASQRERTLPLPARLRHQPSPAMKAASRALRTARQQFQHQYQLHKYRWSNAKVRDAETHDKNNRARNYWRTLDSLFTDRTARDGACTVMEDAEGVATADLQRGVGGAVAQARQVADGAPSVPGETNYDTPAFERTIGKCYTRTRALERARFADGRDPLRDPSAAPFTLAELKKVRGSLQCGKAAGDDNILNEMIKYSGPTMLQWVLDLMNMLRYAETVPDGWRVGRTTPIWKGKRLDKKAWSSYRYIVVTASLCKVYEKLLDARLKAWLDRGDDVAGDHYPHWCHAQGGFRSGRGGQEQIYLLNHVIRLSLAQGLPLYAAFIDLWKAFPSTNRRALACRLHNTSVRGRMWRILDDLGTDLENYVTYAGATSARYSVSDGLREGSSISPTLFNVFIDPFLHHIRRMGLGAHVRMTRGGRIWTGALAYADDIVLLANSPEDLQRLLDEFDAYCRRWLLRPSPPKSKVVVFCATQAQWEQKSLRLSDTEPRRSAIGYTASLLQEVTCPGAAASRWAGARGRSGTVSGVLQAGPRIWRADGTIEHTMLYEYRAYGDGDGAPPRHPPQSAAAAQSASAARDHRRAYRHLRRLAGLDPRADVRPWPQQREGHEWLSFTEIAAEFPDHATSTRSPDGEDAVRLTGTVVGYSGTRPGQYTVRWTAPPYAFPAGTYGRPPPTRMRWAALRPLMTTQPPIPAVSWRLWGRPLEEQMFYEYLGVFFHYLMQWKTHIGRAYGKSTGKLQRLFAMTGGDTDAAIAVARQTHVYQAYVLTKCCFGAFLFPVEATAMVRRLNLQFIRRLCPTVNPTASDAPYHLELGLLPARLVVWKQIMIQAGILQGATVARVQTMVHREIVSAVRDMTPAAQLQFEASGVGWEARALGFARSHLPAHLAGIATLSWRWHHDDRDSPVLAAAQRRLVAEGAAYSADVPSQPAWQAYEAWRARGPRCPDTRQMYNDLCTNASRSAALTLMAGAPPGRRARHWALARRWAAWYMAKLPAPYLSNAPRIHRMRQIVRLRCGTSQLLAHVAHAPVARCPCGADTRGETVAHALLTCTLYQAVRAQHDPWLCDAWDAYVAAASEELGGHAEELPEWGALQARPGLLLLALQGEPLLRALDMTLREQLRLTGTGRLAECWTAWTSVLADAINALFAARTARVDQGP